MSKTIALFGMTGKTGLVLVKKLLENNYLVKALVRKPDSLSFSSPNLTLNQGNVLNEEQVKETIRDTDAVINVIGHVAGSPPDLQTIASKHILKAMNELKVQRLINLTGGGVKVEGDNPGFIDRMVVFIMKNLVGNAMQNRLKDGDDHVRIIRGTNLDWTIVRAPVLLARPAKGKTSIGMVGQIAGYSLTFEDLTDEIVNILKKDLYFRQFPYITNG